MPTTQQAKQTSLSLCGDSAAFINLYAPQKQYVYCSEVKRCYLGTAPTIKEVGEAYGPGSARSWVAFQLRDLSEYAGCKDKMAASQIDGMAEIILMEFGRLKVTEFMHFMLLFKSGNYGRFYGSVDTLSIMTSLRNFIAERDRKVYEWRCEEKKMRKQAEEAKRDLEFRQLRDRYASRIPGAFGADAPMTFLQYRLMGYDSVDDDTLAATLAKIASGEMTLPTEITDMLQALCND